MSIIDKLLEFAKSASAVGSVGTIVIGDVVDLHQQPPASTFLATGRKLGVGTQLYLRAFISTGVVAAGAGTVTYQLVHADNAALTTNPVVLATTAALVTQTSTPAAGVAAGIVLFDDLAIPKNTGLKRYLGITQVIAGNNVTAGAIDAFFTLNQRDTTAYPDAI